MRIIIGLFVFISMALPARADSDTLLPLTFPTFQTSLQKALTKAAIREKLTPMGCLDGGPDKRTVCTFRLGGYMQIMNESEKGKTEVVELTMICAAGDDQVGALKCLLAYAAAMTMTAPEMSSDTRGKIMNILTSGLEVGNYSEIRTDERKYILQKSLGLWFHVMAADYED
jgi:hypothetical protein